VLIGLAINGISKIGIIHHPFSQENPELGRTTIGTLEHGCLTLEYDDKSSREDLLKRIPSTIKPFSIDEIPPEDHKLRVATTISHFS